MANVYFNYALCVNMLQKNAYENAYAKAKHN